MAVSAEIQTKKLQFLEEYLRIDDLAIINKLSELLHSEKTKRIKQLVPMTQEELENKLTNSEHDLEQGRVYTHEEIKRYFTSKRNLG
ncbi:MAG: hypothetical protein U0Y10_14865 [Spirosomataceae bacterium]